MKSRNPSLNALACQATNSGERRGHRVRIKADAPVRQVLRKRQGIGTEQPVGTEDIIVGVDRNSFVPRQRFPTLADPARFRRQPIAAPLPTSTGQSLFQL